MLISQGPHRWSYTSPVFSLTIRQTSNNVFLTMFVHSATVNTQHITHTLPLLKRVFPTVLHTTCLNPNKLPFAKEVVQTEIGHLFEHILLEQLYQQMLKNGIKNPRVTGVTKWNWEKDTWGTFHIELTIHKTAVYELQTPLMHAIDITQMIMRTPAYAVSPRTSATFATV